MKQIVKLKSESSESLTKNLVSTLEKLAGDFNETIQVKSNTDGTYDVAGASGLLMHKFVTECELQGKKFDYEKQTTYVIK